MTWTTWTPSILDVAVKGGALLALAAGVVVMQRHACAALRHRTWALAAAGLLLLPLLCSVVPSLDVRVLPAPDAGPVPVLEVPARDVPGVRNEEAEALVPGTPPAATAEAPPAPASAPAIAGPAATPGAAAPRPATSSVPWFLAIWLAGALVLLARGVASAVRVRVLTRGARPVASPAARAEFDEARRALGLSRPVRLLESAEMAAPATWGFAGPVVLLPAEARTWSRERLRLVLLHELAHVRRGDALLEGVARLGTALHWFDPLAWLALAGLRREGERACDDAVLLAGARPTEYADCLLDVARGSASVPGIAMARRSNLEGRLRAVLAGGTSRRPPRGAGFLAIGCALAAVVLSAAVRPAARALAGDEPATTFDVALDGKAPHATVQAAVDAAAPGAVIRIGPGTFDGAVVLRKAVTLVGAGPDATTLVADVSFTPPGEGGQGPPEAGVHPTIRVEGVTDVVVLRDLGLTGRSERHSGRTRGDAVLLVLSSTARVEHCAIFGTASCGAIVAGRSDVVFDRCLVAAIASDGIVVRASKAVLSDCDLRDCYHYGIAIGPECDATVERCRISGSLWHGIRYDGASPVVRGNAIFENARSGIYASGKTAATVEGNLFLANEMSGMSCWYANGDTIRGNTFADNRREALAVLGASSPLVERNVFAGSPTAVLGGSISGGTEGAFAGPLRLVGNWFWKNERTATRLAPKEGGGVAPPPVDVPWEELAGAKNVQGDPGFAAPRDRDHSLPESSPARAAGAGVPAPLTLASPWVLRKEETAWKETLARERRPKPSPPTPGSAGRNPHAIAKPWIDGLHSLRDASLREAAIASIRKALEGEDPVDHHAAFSTIAASGDVTWDRAALREIVARRLATARGAAQVSGFYALYATGSKPEDVDLLLAALEAPSPEMKEKGSHLLLMLTKGTIEGKATEALGRLLADENRHTLREVLRGIWGAKVSPEVEARLLELARTQDRSLYHDVVYFALSTLQNKSAAVVEALARAAEDADPNNSGRAVWGLSYGVVPAAHAAAADVLLAVVELRSGGREFDAALRGLAEYGTKAHAAKLRALLGSPALGEGRRKAIEETADRIERRAK